jgi:hypothetical protein
MQLQKIICVVLLYNHHQLTIFADASRASSGQSVKWCDVCRRYMLNADYFDVRWLVQFHSGKQAAEMYRFEFQMTLFEFPILLKMRSRMFLVFFSGYIFLAAALNIQTTSQRKHSVYMHMPTNICIRIHVYIQVYDPDCLLQQLIA